LYCDKIVLDEIKWKRKRAQRKL